MSTESNFPRRWPNTSNDSPDVARLTTRLPPLLGVIAGMVDVIGFVSLKLFTAHITGNLVVMAALLVRGGHTSGWLGGGGGCVAVEQMFDRLAHLHVSGTSALVVGHESKSHL